MRNEISKNKKNHYNLGNVFLVMGSHALYY